MVGMAVLAFFQGLAEGSPPYLAESLPPVQARIHGGTAVSASAGQGYVFPAFPGYADRL